MITNERELEDFFDAHIDIIKTKIQESFSTSQGIRYIGRQVCIGNNNRLDMLFSYDSFCDSPYRERIRDYIVVELKFRPLCIDDLTQLSRYMDAVYSAAEYNKDDLVSWDVKGVLVGPSYIDNLGTYHAHIIDNERIKIWNVSDYLRLSELENREDLGLTEIDRHEVDSRMLVKGEE